MQHHTRYSAEFEAKVALARKLIEKSLMLLLTAMHWEAQMPLLKHHNDDIEIELEVHKLFEVLTY